MGLDTKDGPSLAKTVAFLVFRNWKSTATGVLIAINSCLIAVKLLPPGSGKVVIGIAVSGALISCMKKDAGKELVNLPGSSDPVLVDSHETPNDPAAVVVK